MPDFISRPDQRPGRGAAALRALQSLLGSGPAWLWSINLALAGAFVAWLLTDPRFEASVNWWRFGSAGVTDSRSIRDMGDWWWLGWRNRSVLVLASVVVFTTLLLIAGSWMGRTRHRTLRAWMMLTAIVAVWLGILVHWQDLAWTGKQFRLRGLMHQFDRVVADLQSNWPDRDGDQAVIGPFMAYPVARPATLILLTLPEFQNTTTTFSVVEGGAGVIRFELVGAERGDWLEWHPAGSIPSDFVSGLEERYQIERFQQLSHHWYLARYHFERSAIIGGSPGTGRGGP